MTRAPDFPIAKILEELGFEDVPRIRGGGYAKVRCLFHGDTRPSATVSQYGFQCHACGRSGDAIKLLREELGISYADALARAAEITGIRSGGSTAGTTELAGSDLLAI